jgi:O-antigen/teichoic acid export membrane protein
MTTIVATGLICIGAIWGMGITTHDILLCLAPLLCSLYAENQYALVLAEFWSKRKLKAQTGWSTLRATCGFVMGLAGTLIGGVTGLACGVAIGNTAAYLVLRYRRREWWRYPYDPKVASVLRAVWFHITLASMLGFAGEYIPRIVLSIWHPFSEVSHLYAATSVMALFLVLASCCSYAASYLLAGYHSPTSLREHFQAKENCRRPGGPGHGKALGQIVAPAAHGAVCPWRRGDLACVFALAA